MLEDSRVLGKKKPMELLVGKQFKLEVWEQCLKTMRRNEVAEFTVDKMVSLQEQLDHFGNELMVLVTWY